MSQRLSALVVVEAATYLIDKPYEYAIPDALRDAVKPGVRVRVSFGRGIRRADGIVLKVSEADDGHLGIKLKPILEVLDLEPVLNENMLKLAIWMREQYFCTFFDAARVMLPTGVWHKFDYVYTPSGKFDLNEAKKLVGKSENGKEIAGYISNSPKPTFKELSELYGEECVKKTVSALFNEGMLEISETCVRNVSEKTERIIRLVYTRDDVLSYIERKHPRAAVCETLMMLCDIGAASVKELKYFTGITVSQINTLRKNGVIDFENTEVYRRPKRGGVRSGFTINLNYEQQDAYNDISEDMKKTPSCTLLYGVTGSGKTFVYFKLIEDVIHNGKKAILLVPEIALTPQLLSLVYSYFGDGTAVLHSGLSVGERYDEWRRIKNGDVDVVIGTRSAIFAPLENIGIIIIDEEHEDTYKSSSNPRYSTREVAKFRCVSESAFLLLGSATPSVESMYSTHTGKYNLRMIAKRYNAKPLPKVIVSDMRKSLAGGNDSALGSELRSEIAENLTRGEQTILFLNRRGASKYVLCGTCGEVPGCPNCSIPLVYHSKNSRLMCHHCGYSQKLPDKCPNCGEKLQFVGCGTQRVEDEIKTIFPGTEVIRMDADTTSGKDSHEKLLTRFKEENVPILLGTQMITKGLDFENVTLVGVINADQAIYNECYKSAENTFSLITQVIGRAGRGDKNGRAVIQTYCPSNPIIRSASEQNFGRFLTEELELRKARALPPFSDVFSLMVTGDSELETFKAAARLRERIDFALSSKYRGMRVKILGPAPASIVKISGKYRYNIILRTKNTRRARNLVSQIIRDFLANKQNKKFGIIPDINSTDI